MKRESSDNDPTVLPQSGGQRCICCGGVIDMPDQAIGLGLSLALGLVSDECALVCDGCTASLIAARAAQNSPAHRLLRQRKNTA